MEIYVVQNKEGKYFRSIGYGGGGRSWVEKLEDAKFYTKLGQARSRCTYWFKHFPKFGCPKILVFTLGVENMREIDMEAETQKAIVKGERAKAKQRIRSIEWELQRRNSDKARWQAEADKLQAELAKLK